MNVFERLTLGVIAAAALCGGARPVAAQFTPNKPIEMVIMAGEGGGADQMARLIQSIVEQERLSARPLIPVNMAGGSGAEALLHMKSAADPDYSIMVTLNSFFTTPLRQPSLEIDITEFAPIARMAEDTFVLWTHKNNSVRDFDQFLAEAGRRGSGWVMGGTGAAQEDEIITAYLNNAYVLHMKYVPYKGGGAVAEELAGAQLDSSVNNPSEAAGFYRSGDLIPLVAFTDERLPQFPDVPTLKEKGGDFSYFMQRMVVGAPRMSAPALAYYTELFHKVFDSERWRSYRDEQSLTGEFMSGEELVELWRNQRHRHRNILRAVGSIR